MDVRLWGPHAWEFMHAATFGYPEDPTAEEKAGAAAFFGSLLWVLPCETCRNHYREMLVMMPVGPHLQDRASLSRWLVELHNRVNERTGKPRLDYEFVRQRYEGMRGACREEINRHGQPPCGPTGRWIGTVLLGMFAAFLAGALLLALGGWCLRSPARRP